MKEIIEPIYGVWYWLKQPENSGAVTALAAALTVVMTIVVNIGMVGAAVFFRKKSETPTQQTDARPGQDHQPKRGVTGCSETPESPMEEDEDDGSPYDGDIPDDIGFVRRYYTTYTPVEGYDWDRKPPSDAIPEDEKNRFRHLRIIFEHLEKIDRYEEAEADLLLTQKIIKIFNRNAPYYSSYLKEFTNRLRDFGQHELADSLSRKAPVKSINLENAINEDDFEYVGFWKRTGASIIDHILLLLVVIPALLFIDNTQYQGSFSSLFNQVLMEFYYLFFLPSVKTIWFWFAKQATPGKMAVRAKIVDANTGSDPTIGQCIGRFLGYNISLLMLGFGILWIAFDTRKQGWHDKLAGTVVISPKRSQAERNHIS